MVLSSTDPHIYWLAGIYVVARLAGKYLGIYAACKIAGENSNVTRTMPSQLIPQTGVAAVEAVFLAQTLGKPELAGIILPGIVFFGIAGVVQVERALKRFLVREREEEAEAERHLHAQPPSGKVRAARKLLSYLVPESIMLGLQGSNKMEVIETMVDHALEVTHQHIDREQALQVLAEREDLAPTGLGHGIAMPHCRLIGLDEAVVIIGRHEEGVVFGGIDNEPCNIILLMCSSGRAAGEHLQLMAAVGHLLGSSTIREKILDAENAKEVMQVLIDTAELGEEAAEAANSTGGGRSTAEVNQTAG
jgi:PTS system nitrogen regulatory IIA component